MLVVIVITLLHWLVNGEDHINVLYNIHISCIIYYLIMVISCACDTVHGRPKEPYSPERRGFGND